MPSATNAAKAHPAQFLRRHPHWVLLVLSLMCWVNYLWVAMGPGGGGHHQHDHGAATRPLQDLAGQGVAWLLMVYAMMLPMLSSAMRWLLMVQPRYQHWKVAFCFLVGYSALWMLAGLALIALQPLAKNVFNVLLPAAASLPVEALAFLAAGLISRAGYRRRAVYACGAGVPMRINGVGALVDAFRFGVTKGLRCAASCLHLMIALIIAGHGIALMFLAMVVLLFERQQVPRKTRTIELFCYLVALLYLVNWIVKAL